jgi:aminoglycoside phosphotransferase (APT) family kinase protein
MTERYYEIIRELHAIDAASIRPIRAGDSVRLAELEAKAELLRQELKGLS